MVVEDDGTNHSVIQGISVSLDKRMQLVRTGTEKESDCGTNGALHARRTDARGLATGDKE